MAGGLGAVGGVLLRLVECEVEGVGAGDMDGMDRVDDMDRVKKAGGRMMKTGRLLIMLGLVSALPVMADVPAPARQGVTLHVS